MVLTEEQKRELLMKYIDPTKDFVRADNGKILVSVEASQRIAKEFNLKIDSNAQFEPVAIFNYIIQREEQRLAAAASIARSKEAKEAAGPLVPFAFIILRFLRVIFDPVKINILT